MCGIVGYTGKRPVVDVLLKGLKRLEYRGYDSAGIAFFETPSAKKITLKKSEGKIVNVQKLVEPNLFAAAVCGMGHTRWATHGKPTTQNAHPHQTGDVVLVHNGIIENYQEIKKEIVSKGYHPESETDSELYGFLVLEEMKAGKKFADAVRSAFLKLEGSCSVVVMCEREPGVVIGVRNGSPLVAAIDPKGGAMLASDAQPLLDYTNEVYFMENGDMAIARPEGVEFVSLRDGKTIKREKTRLDWTPETMDKQGFAHYMLKEIYEQPRTFVDTLNTVLDRAKTDPFPMADHPGVEILAGASELVLVACGTSWHSSILGKYWLERWAGIPVAVEHASEFRYRDPVVRTGAVIVGVTQSGETADTLGVIREMRARGYKTLAITNVRGSTISREANATFYISAGPEIGVAATKTFTSTLLMFMLWAGFLGMRGKDSTARKLPQIFDQLIRFPHLYEASLQDESGMRSTIQRVAKQVADKGGFFYMGRGYNYPVALEAALKLKEIAYVYAEGYPGGELKHGPIAMIDETIVVVVVVPRDTWREKTVSNLQEVKARGAFVVGVGNADDRELEGQCDAFIPLPSQAGQFDESLLPFLTTVVIQLLGYEVAVLKGTHIDQPRNLAKSVTVE